MFTNKSSAAFGVSMVILASILATVVTGNNIFSTSTAPENITAETNEANDTSMETNTTIAPLTTTIPPSGVINWPAISNTSFELATNRQYLEKMLFTKTAKLKGDGHTHPPPLGSRIIHFTQHLHGKNIDFQKFVTDVSILVYVARIDYMDIESQSLTFAALVNLTWWDLSLKWDPEKDSPLRQIMMDIKDVWNPYVLPEDIQDFVFIPDNNQVNNKHHKVVVQYDGRCENTFWATFSVPCGVNVMTFPFDTHRCHLRLSQMTNWGEEINYISVKFDNGSVRRTTLFNQRHHHKEWQLLNLKSSVVENGLVYKLEIDLRRKAVFYAVVLIMPCIILNLLSFLMFIVPVKGTERVDLALNLILSYFVLLMIMTDSLPPSGGKVPLLGMYLAMSITVVLINLVSSLILMYLYKKKQQGKHVPSALKAFEKPVDVSLLWRRFCSSVNAKCCKKVDGEMDENDVSSKKVEANEKRKHHSFSIGLGGEEETESNQSESEIIEKEKMDYVIFNLNILFFAFTVFAHIVLAVAIAVYYRELWYV